MRTAPSPTTEQPPSNLTSSATVQHEPGTPRNTTATKLQDLTNSNNNKPQIPTVTVTNGSDDNEISQIESVL